MYFIDAPTDRRGLAFTCQKWKSMAFRRPTTEPQESLVLERKESIHCEGAIHSHDLPGHKGRGAQAEECYGTGNFFWLADTPHRGSAHYILLELHVLEHL